MTDKNRALLRIFDDVRLLAALVQLPDRLWHAARQRLPKSRTAFIELQTALAIDILIHVPLRMQNLAALKFDEHLHWPQGRRKPGLVTFRVAETKNDVPLEFEIPTTLADRLHIYRNEIAPVVIGERPNAVFVSLTGKPKGQDAITVNIEKTVLRYLGVKLSEEPIRSDNVRFSKRTYSARLGKAAIGPTADIAALQRANPKPQGRAFEVGAKSALMRTVQALEDTMDEQWQSFTSMFTKLAQDLKLPRVDTEKLIEAHRKNIDALARSAEAASEGAKSLAVKQREIVEEAIRETSAMVRDFKLESPQDAATKQAEFARKAFEAAVRNTRDVAELVQRSSTDALKVIQDRMKESFEEIRGSIEKK